MLLLGNRSGQLPETLATYLRLFDIAATLAHERKKAADAMASKGQLVRLRITHQLSSPPIRSRALTSSPLAFQTLPFVCASRFQGQRTA